MEKIKGMDWNRAGKTRVEVNAIKETLQEYGKAYVVGVCDPSDIVDKLKELGVEVESKVVTCYEYPESKPVVSALLIKK